jgi:hypothetical protein
MQKNFLLLKIIFIILVRENRGKLDLFVGAGKKVASKLLGFEEFLSLVIQA